MPSPIRTINIEEQLFPKLLKETPFSPQTLFYKGTLPEENSPAVAIVGTRKATHEGVRLAKEIAGRLAEKGIAIISGLALGIDAAAHEGAIAQRGKTYAVLAHGLHTIYPKHNEALANKILESGGGILSAYPEGKDPLPHQFLERNGIIAGLSLATIIIEAPLQSGALVTAKHALDAGREVFVLPGPSHHPNYAGNHMLIRNGARLVRNAEDILEDLGFNSETPTAEEKNFNDNEERMIFETIQAVGKPTDIDNIIENTRLDAAVVKQKLTMLTLQGFIEERNGKFIFK